MDTVKQQLAALRIIHVALLLGVTLFGMATHFLLVDHATATTDITGNVPMFLGIAFLVNAAAILIGPMLARSMVRSRHAGTDLATMIRPYVTGNIVKFALLEGALLFTIICYMLTNNYLFLLMVLFSYVVFMLRFPSRLRFAEQMGLNHAQREELSRKL